MSTVNALLVSSIAGMSTLIGSFVILFNIKEDKINKFITLCLSFSISIMIGLSITDLIPSSFFYILFNKNIIIGIFTIILVFLVSFISVIFISSKVSNNNNSLYKLGILSMLAIILHNIPEGVVTFMGSIKDYSLGIKLAIAIMLHNIPEGISIAVPIYYATKSKAKAILNTFISGLAEPIGALLTYLLLNRFITDFMLNITLLFVAGIMITISINELLPKVLTYKENKYIYYGFIAGIILIIINHFSF